MKLMRCSVSIIFVCLITCVVLTWSKKKTRNNSCSTIRDYFNNIDTNPRCWYDFTVELTTPDIIRGYGYPVETHIVKNSDGYLLTLFRVPNYDAKIKRGVVFIQHGLMTSSVDFLLKYNESLVLMLNDEGYDVWLGNSRGNEYSNTHESLTVEDDQFWNYDVTDLSQVDLPLLLDYVTNTSGKSEKIIYIAHSLGCTVALQYAAAQPERAKKIFKIMILLAPAWYTKHTTSPLKLIVPYSDLFLNILKSLGLFNVFSDGLFLRRIIKPLCTSSASTTAFCFEGFQLTLGPRYQTSVDRVLSLWNHFPSGGSLNILGSIASSVSKYDLGKISIPVHIVASEGDTACTVKDSEHLYKDLRPEVRYGFEVLPGNFNHGDFLTGRNVKVLLYEKLVEFVNKIS